ncbi:hypothetical protein HK102_007440 [Quaeritorhiza haematococci]|nr:hypothetical protein HK102_007440 [Quaeritorhiza haematococci]
MRVEGMPSQFLLFVSTCIALAPIALLLRGVKAGWPAPRTAERLVLKPQTTTPIKNVVITVLENRSFDCICGYFDYSPEIDGLVNNQICYPTDLETPDSKKYYPDDPAHDVTSVSFQVFGHNIADNTTSSKIIFPATMNGFIDHQTRFWNESDHMRLQRIVDGYKPSSIPVLHKLSQEYVLFDRWFSSFPGSTQPNRLFVHSATSNGEIDSNFKSYPEGYPQRSIWSVLSENGLDWSAYWMEIPSMVVLKELRQPQYWHRFKKYQNNFEQDALSGNLPDVTFIDPIYGTFPWNRKISNDGRAPGDIRHSEILLKEIYEILRRSPQWENLLWIITYDEHGGFADHVPTPLNVPNPDGVLGKDGNNFPFDRLGLRVPTIMNGPFPNSQYEHSSIPATLLKLWDIKAPTASGFLTKRDEWASTFEWLFKTREYPRQDCPWHLPDPIPLDAPESETASASSEETLVGTSTQMGEELSGPFAGLLQATTEAEARDFAVWNVLKAVMMQEGSQRDQLMQLLGNVF